MKVLEVVKSDTGLTYLLPIDEDRMRVYLCHSEWQELNLFCVHHSDKVLNMVIFDFGLHEIDFYSFQFERGSTTYKQILTYCYGCSFKGFFHRLCDLYMCVAPFLSKKMQEFILKFKNDPLLYFG